MTTSLSDSNPGGAGCYHNPRTTRRSLSRKSPSQADWRMTAVRESYGERCGPILQSMSGCTGVAREWASAMECGHAIDRWKSSKRVTCDFLSACPLTLQKDRKSILFSAIVTLTEWVVIIKRLLVTPVFKASVKIASLYLALKSFSLPLKGNMFSLFHIQKYTHFENKRFLLKSLIQQ